MSQTTQIVEVLLEKAMMTYESQQSMLPMVSFFEPDGDKLQISGNVVWRPVQQHAPIISGFDISTQETDIIEEAYPAVLGDPQNDFVVQRADQVRDLQYWERRGEQSGRRQASNLNQQIVSAMTLQGSLFTTSAATSGYPFIGEGQALMNERQGYESMRYYMLNDRDTLKFATDLAARQTLQGRPEDTWKKGQIGQNVAGFDVYTGSFLPNLIGGASPDATVTGAQTFAPEGGTVNATTRVVTNVDYREAVIPVSASASYNIGDKIKFVNVSTGDIIAVGLDDKTVTDQAMTFTIVAKPTGTSITIFPKPIAADDAALSDLEKAYANVDTIITNLSVVTRLNTAASNKVNLFWDKDAVEVLGGNIPVELFKQFDGMKVVSTTMSNGQQMYILYDGDIATLNFRFRIFTWFGITIADPQRVGIALTT